MKTYLLWAAGFAVLFALNALVELVVLPAWDLDHTPKNDAYFMAWWAAVGLWLVCGHGLSRAWAGRGPAAEPAEGPEPPVEREGRCT